MEKTAQSTKMIHERLGGGLRIFIKRPWFSSGVDEKLAILIPSKNNTFSIIGRSTPYSQDYTNWGIDPILLLQNQAEIALIFNILDLHLKLMKT